MYAKAEKQVNQQVQEAGEQATFDVGIHDLHPELVRTLGRLRFRTSFGQNVLNHSLEVAYLCGVMAAELGLDPVPAKRAGLLHDLGKAIDHEIEGPHATSSAPTLLVVSGKSLKSCTLSRPIMPTSSPIAFSMSWFRRPTPFLPLALGLAKKASRATSSASRSSRKFANAHKGVERTYAMQAGREIRVMVVPDQVDEAAAVVLAHDIAKQIEDEMQYPGQVKVVVIRESRAVDYAK